MKEKVVLAYSGGLDTTAIIPWLKENFDYEVICVCVNCGQAEELDGLEERAKACGASKLYIEDVIDEFCDVIGCIRTCFPAMFKCAARLYTMPLAIIIRKAVSLFW